MICSSRARNAASPSSVKISAIGFPARSLDDGVDIGEGDAEPFGEQGSDRALAGAGGTDQHDGPSTPAQVDAGWVLMAGAGPEVRDRPVA